MHTQSITRSTRPIRRETHEHALRRLAVEARARGLRIYTYPHTHEFYCSSHGQPDVLHRVTRLSCDCRGFIQRGRCTHHALLLSQLGELPEPTPPAISIRLSVICDQCGVPMTHVAGVTFQCPCGARFVADWEAVDCILAQLNRVDPDDLEGVARLLSATHHHVGPDPDQEPDRGDAPGLLGLDDFDANEIAAALIWAASRVDVAGRTAA